VGKKILVTGAAGFIGSHLCEALLQRGDTVVGIDDFNDYYSPERKRANVAEIRAAHAEGFELVECDLRQPDAVNAVLRDRSIDVVVHLAAMAGVRASIDRPRVYFQVNVGGTLNLLEAMRASGLRHIVFGSTSSAYGDTQQIPFEETDPSDRPLAPYPASKRSAELLGYSYHHLHGFDFTALRFFTVYGPRGRPDMMPYKVMHSAAEGHEVPLFGGGEMRRDWTYVSDIVAGVVAAVDKPMGFEIINIGRGEPVQVSEFVAEVERVTGKRANLRPTDTPATEIDTTFAKLDKARALLGYEPKVSFKDGIARFWDWYQSAKV